MLNINQHVNMSLVSSCSTQYKFVCAETPFSGDLTGVPHRYDKSKKEKMSICLWFKNVFYHKTCFDGDIVIFLG